MKKLIFSFLLILLLGGTIFYFGWIQILLPPNTFAVIFTKTGGWEDRVIYPGTFSWKWERLLPTNMTLYKFSIQSMNYQSKIQGVLPSGDLYASLLEESPDFNYSFSYNIEYSLIPEKLPALIQEGRYNENNIDKLYKTIEQQFQSSLNEIIYNTIREEKYDDIDFFYSSVPDLLKDLSVTKIPEINVLLINPVHIEYPDFQLYEKLKNQYFSLMDVRHRSLTEEESKRVSQDVTSEREFELLAKYGELLTKYPVLLQYLSLKSKGDDNLLDINLSELEIPEHDTKDN